MEGDVAAFADKLNILMREKSSASDQIHAAQQKQADLQSNMASLKMKSDMLLAQDTDKEDIAYILLFVAFVVKDLLTYIPQPDSIMPC